VRLHLRLGIEELTLGAVEPPLQIVGAPLGLFRGATSFVARGLNGTALPLLAQGRGLPLATQRSGILFAQPLGQPLLNVG
jgi:hypothetical protein